jgi:D-sedoheptulose 7-phosphate isomerase
MKAHLDTINDYLNTLKKVCDDLPRQPLLDILAVLETARAEKSAVFICGNGGSWATASHMVCDFGKNTRQPDRNRMIVIGLGDNVPSLTAYANDEGYDRIFAEPLLSLMEPGDVLIAISGSGNSPNVLRAVETARDLEGITIGLTGFEGGKLGEMVDHALVVPSDSMEMIEDFHMIIDHILTICLRG